MSRVLVERKAKYPHDKESFDYPFGEIPNYRYGMVKSLIHQSYDEAVALAGDFPNNIVDWLWSSAGDDDEMPWLLLCRLSNGAYAFYEAGYQYSGFTIVGDMDLVVSRNLSDIIEYGMGDYQYSQYLIHTDL